MMGSASNNYIVYILIFAVIVAPILYGFLKSIYSSPSNAEAKKEPLDELYGKEKENFHGKDESHFIDSLDPHKRHYHALQTLKSVPVFSLASGYYPFLSKGCFSYKYADAFIPESVLCGCGITYSYTDKAIPLMAITEDLGTVMVCSGGKLGSADGKIYRIPKDSIKSCEIAIDSSTNIKTDTVSLSPEKLSKVNKVIKSISLKITTDDFEHPIHHVLISSRTFDLGKVMEASDQSEYKKANNVAETWQARLLTKSDKKAAPKKAKKGKKETPRSPSEPEAVD